MGLSPCLETKPQEHVQVAEVDTRSRWVLTQGRPSFEQRRVIEGSRVWVGVTVSEVNRRWVLPQERLTHVRKGLHRRYSGKNHAKTTLLPLSQPTHTRVSSTSPKHTTRTYRCTVRKTESQRERESEGDLRVCVCVCLHMSLDKDKRKGMT